MSGFACFGTHEKRSLFPIGFSKGGRLQLWVVILQTGGFGVEDQQIIVWEDFNFLRTDI